MSDPVKRYITEGRWKYANGMTRYDGDGYSAEFVHAYDYDQLAAQLAAAQTRNAQLEATLAWVLNDVQEWCDAVDRDASWDGWDHHYKAFAYGRRGEDSGLNKARKALASFGGKDNG